MITAEQIKRFAPGAKPALIDAIIRNWSLAVKAGIEKVPQRLHGFMATIGVETGGLKSIDENLNYSAKRLNQVWPNRFPTVAAAQPFANNPKKLGIKVYGGRLGNKAAPSTDGYDYRGGGMLQTTGRDNYRAMGYEDNPDALRDPDIAFQTAVREWTARKCNALADKLDKKAVRKAVNGGYNGIDEFLAYWKKAASVWKTVGDDSDSEVVRVYTPPEETPPEVDEPAAPAARIYTDPETVEKLQQQLRDLGFTEVGAPDGKIGKMTRTAILAFRNEHDLPLSPDIDDDLLLALQSAKPRELEKERAEATPAEVRQAVPEAQASFLSKAWAWFIGGGAGLVGASSAAGEADPDKNGILRQVLGVIQDIPGWMWCAVIVVVAIAIIYASNKGEKAASDAYKAGARR